MTNTDRIDAGALEKACIAVLLHLASKGVPPDILEVLTRGDGRGSVPPGALKSALAALPADTAGWRMVPVEPDDRMIAAVRRKWGLQFNGGLTEAIREYIRAAIAAAPPPPAGGNTEQK